MTYAPAAPALTSGVLPEQPAARLRRPRWRDPRLVTGLVIVALSVAAGSWAVSAASRTVPVFVADGALTPGEPVTAGSLRVADVRLGAGTGRYLPADAPLPGGLVALRVVDDGELVPLSALGAGADVRSVAVPVGSGLSDRIRAGAVVDLWFVPAAPVAPEADRPEPRTLASDVVVEQVDAADGAIVVNGEATLHVLVPSDALPAVLAALTDTGTVAVVPVAGGVR
ncbi:hypothetical protein ACFQHV_21755 [Promicromonospora thailandica]|uniref:SAF domain-containing protein n=1 Tax=Promicromonospora thailandica TaxID=765201 RepID=A0A9X2FXM5_9MICO|nr:hypothetical protein [Promicromonospora thailandica]MCP2263167.1 hypothetical protein [Promicromonospora thailandica]BFF18552.1 flagellar protein FlgA [Promicromonospora thailandica]